MPAAMEKSPALNIFAQHKKFVERMRKQAAGYFRKREYSTSGRQPYILKEKKDWHNNIILPEVANRIQSDGCKLHRWIHHGLSSQAMLFNLMGPLLTRKDYEPLIKILEVKGISLPINATRGIFEYENREILNELEGQPTSIDLALFSDSAPPVFIEAKFTESEFGGCSYGKNEKFDGNNPMNNHNVCPLKSKGMNYWDLISEYDILDDGWQNAEECPLLKHYQFFREVLFAAKQNGYFVLLYDERNPVFVNRNYEGDPGLFTELQSRLPDNIRQRLFAVSLQEIFHSIEDSNSHNDWIDEFAEKYGLQ